MSSNKSRSSTSLLESDTRVLKKYFADDVRIVHGDGKLITKAEEIENFTSGASSSNPSRFVNKKYGDMAVADLLASVKHADHEKLVSGDVRNIRVWVKQKGNWKVVSFQITRAAPPSQ